ncbi:SDR family oxidoreductase [Methylorubrum salsuginis]|uniref:NAD(P)-dependent dehydrogenase, short-chain alcohol dehydrogenase family n=1 Tax=Methylorubrum salsuginis TaxID=414703 RepID=A0A1I4L4U2_9HYPH|nr:SDR family oxidoreductase [Methylorubrum salsuginis]SFL85899.1 NAD(P)-dependent dehydrogenase, short-chain alcohol dehydrogenase family [Methylorubrum salsuginis]
MGKLNGKIAVITGGSDGMGRSTARLFVEEGATVIITGRNQDTLDAAVREIGGSVEAFRGDIGKLTDLDALKVHVENKHGRVDVLFANAGGARLGPFEQVKEEDFDYTFDTNAKGTFFTVQRLLPLIPNGGSVILNTSIAGSKGLPDFSVYSATKAAIRSFARTLTTDLKGRGIRVNALAPGHTATGIMRKTGIPVDSIDGINARIQAQVPAGRIGTGDDIAKAALFLASDDASYVTGIELTVDGGWAQV